jgi:hypothetical protein
MNTTDHKDVLSERNYKRPDDIFSTTGLQKVILNKFVVE